MPLKNVTCLDCGKTRQVVNYSFPTRCKRCAVNMMAKASIESKKRAGLITLACRRCGEIFTSKRSRRAKYCGTACRRNGVTLKCATCDTAFQVRKSHAESARFCSRACCSESLKDKTGLRRFGALWNESREAALAANPFCACCGRLSKLHVHHIIPFRLWPTHHQANLIPLCGRCHETVEMMFVRFENAGSFNPSQYLKGLILWRVFLIERQNLTKLRLQDAIKDFALKTGKSPGWFRIPIIRAIMMPPWDECANLSGNSDLGFPSLPPHLAKFAMDTSALKPRLGSV